MDAIDHHIVAWLLRHGRATFGELGAQVNLSAPAVKRRVDKLEASGVIAGYAAVVDYRALGWRTQAFVDLFCAARSSPASIRAAVAGHPEVVAAYTVTGETDALLHVRAADMVHLEEALERIRREPDVTRTNTQLVLSQLLERPAAI